MVEQRAYPTLRADTVPRRGAMETLPPEHCFWNGQTPVPLLYGDDLVSVRFLERARGVASLGAWRLCANTVAQFVYGGNAENLWRTIFIFSGASVVARIDRSH